MFALPGEENCFCQGRPDQCLLWLDSLFPKTVPPVIHFFLIQQNRGLTFRKRWFQLDLTEPPQILHPKQFWGAKFFSGA